MSLSMHEHFIHKTYKSTLWIRTTEVEYHLNLQIFCKYFIFYTNVGVAWGYGVWMGDLSSISKKLGWIESQLLLNLDWRCGNSLQIQIVIQSAWTIITVSYFHTMSFLELRLTINIYWHILHSPTKRESNMALCTNPSRTDLLRDIGCIIRINFK